MMKPYTVEQNHDGWSRMVPVLLIPFLLFLACTTMFDAAVIYVARIGVAAAGFVILMIFAQSYVTWLYFVQMVPVLRKHATEFPNSVNSCAALFSIAALLSSALAGIGMYVLLSNH